MSAVPSHSPRPHCCSIRWRHCCHGYNNKHLHKLHGHILLLTQQTASQHQEDQEECVKYCRASSTFSTSATSRVGAGFLKSEDLVAEMPIASGAAGRVDVGVDNSMTWTPDGLRRGTKPANRNCDSYLQRYEELKQRKINKRNLLQVVQVNTDPKSDNEKDGAKEVNPEKSVSSEEHTSGNSGQKSQKSQLCVVL